MRPPLHLLMKINYGVDYLIREKLKVVNFPTSNENLYFIKGLG